MAQDKWSLYQDMSVVLFKLGGDYYNFSTPEHFHLSVFLWWTHGLFGKCLHNSIYFHNSTTRHCCCFRENWFNNEINQSLAQSQTGELVGRAGNQSDSYQHFCQTLHRSRAWCCAAFAALPSHFQLLKSCFHSGLAADKCHEQGQCLPIQTKNLQCTAHQRVFIDC